MKIALYLLISLAMTSLNVTMAWWIYTGNLFFFPGDGFPFVIAIPLFTIASFPILHSLPWNDLSAETILGATCAFLLIVSYFLFLWRYQTSKNTFIRFLPLFFIPAINLSFAYLSFKILA